MVDHLHVLRPINTGQTKQIIERRGGIEFEFGKEDMNLESFLELFRVEFHLLYHVRIVPFALLCLNCLNIRRCNMSALHMRALDSTSLTYSFG